MMLGVLNFVIDDVEAMRIMRRPVDAVVPGSYLVISHPTAEIDAEPAKNPCGTGTSMAPR